MKSKVAIAELDGNVQGSLNRALSLVGNIDDLNTKDRTVVIKVGVLDPQMGAHSTVDTVGAIVNCFSQASGTFLAEPDNYMGKALERLQIWKTLFSDRAMPFSLSDDPQTRKVTIAGDEINLSHVLFKPNVLVSTHILRDYEKGSLIKNLFGLMPQRTKAKYHRKLNTVLLDLYEAVSGIDLAVLDATYSYFMGEATPDTLKDPSQCRVKTNTLIVGRDAVAVETVGAVLAGMNPRKMPLLQKAAERGFGECDLSNVEVVGRSFGEVREEFSAALEAMREKWSKH
jgi:uncharacterized protein (DUF362 family)